MSKPTTRIKEGCQPPIVRRFEYWEHACVCGFQAKSAEEWQRHGINYQGCGGGRRKKFNRSRGSDPALCPKCGVTMEYYDGWNCPTDGCDNVALRLYRCYGGCEHHANVHKAYAASREEFIEMIRAEYGDSYPISEPGELKTEPNADVMARPDGGPNT